MGAGIRHPGERHLRRTPRPTCRCSARRSLIRACRLRHSIPTQRCAMSRSRTYRNGPRTWSECTKRGPLSVRLSYNRRSSYPEGPLDQRREGPGNAPINYTLARSRQSRCLGSTSRRATTCTDNFTLFFDWTNILKKPFKSDIVRTNYTNGAPASQEIFPMVVRYEEISPLGRHSIPFRRWRATRRAGAAAGPSAAAGGRARSASTTTTAATASAGADRRTRLGEPKADKQRAFALPLA